MRAIFRFLCYNSNCLIGKSPLVRFVVRVMIFRKVWSVVEFLVDTVPFSLTVALGNVVLAAMTVAFVTAGAHAWTHRGKERGEHELTAGDLWVGVVFLLST